MHCERCSIGRADPILRFDSYPGGGRDGRQKDALACAGNVLTIRMTKHVVTAAAVAEPAQYSRSYLIYGVGLLGLINAINIMDRQVISVLTPAIKAEMHMSDMEIGFLSGFAFSIFYAILGIPIAAYADRSIRRNVVAVSLLAWSSMTAICGFAQSFLQLALARVGVGVGEAGCLPPTHSMVSDYFPASARARVLGIIASGGTIGGMTATMLGGYLVSTVGWRETLYLFAIPGVVVGMLVFLTLREPMRGVQERRIPTSSANDLTTLWGLTLQRRSYLHMVVAVGAGTIVSYGWGQWLPSFYLRSYGVSMRDIGFTFGAVQALASMTGTVSGGFIGDRLMRQRGARSLLMFGIFTSLMTFFCSLGIVLSQTMTTSLIFNFGSSACGVAFIGPAFALVQGVAPARLRARASAVLTLSVSLIGYGMGPLFVGFLSDTFAAAGHGDASLRKSMLWGCIFALWPIIHYALARRTIVSDMPTSDTSV